MKTFKETYECDSITLNVTNKCNLSCSYCFEHDKNGSFMTKEVAIKVIEDSYRKVPKETGVFTINLFGGEPFLNWEVMKDIIDYVNEKKYMVKFGVTTNLTVLTDEMLDYIDDNDIMLLVSIDGIKKVHDKNRCNSYDVVINNINKLIDRELTHLIEARMTILPEDVIHMSDGVRELIDMGINNICPMCVTDTEWSDDDISNLKVQYHQILLYYLSILNDKDNKRNISIKNTDEIICNVLEPEISDTMMCPIGNNKWCSIDTNGDVYPCHQCPTSDNKELKSLIIGNVYTGIDETKIRLDEVHGKFDRKECIQCEGKSICKSGCPAQNLTETGKYDLPTKAHCDISKAFVQVAKTFRYSIISADNIRGRLLNLLKENLKLKRYLDEEVKTTNIHSVEFMMKISHFSEMYELLKGNLIPTFDSYFKNEIACITAFILAERGKKYGESR